MNSNERNLYRDLQEIRKLWNEWDPIGVCPSENDILDEYDFYLELTLQLLRQTATTVEIENYLNLVLEEFMGFDDAYISHCKPHEFANKLHAWFQKLQKNINN